MQKHWLLNILQREGLQNTHLFRVGSQKWFDGHGPPQGVMRPSHSHLRTWWLGQDGISPCVNSIDYAPIVFSRERQPSCPYWQYTTDVEFGYYSCLGLTNYIECLSSPPSSNFYWILMRSFVVVSMETGQNNLHWAQILMNLAPILAIMCSQSDRILTSLPHTNLKITWQ